MSDTDTHPRQRPTTRAAEGLPRFRWTLAKFEQLIEQGILDEDDRVELIGGELIPMAAKGIRHEIVRGVLQNWLRRNAPLDIEVYSEPGWRPYGETYVEPDLLVAPPGALPTSADPREVLLVIEIARSSLAYDLGTKAETYSRLGVRDYWVIDARRLVTRVHRQPSLSGYAEKPEAQPTEEITALLLPGLSLRLADLRFD